MITRAGGARKGVRVWLPRGLDFTELLPPELWPHADGGRLFLGRIVDRAARGHADDDGFVSLSSRLLRDDIGRDAWPRIRRAFESVVETSPHVAGLRCRGYRLLVGGEPVRWPLHDPRVVARVLASRERFRQQQDARLLPVHRALRDVLRSVTVANGVDAAVASLDKPWARTCQSAAVQRIRDGSPAFSVGRTGRLHSTLTGLHKSLRPFVRLAGERVAGIDIETCQPSLLAATPDLWVGRHHHTPPLGQNGCPHNSTPCGGPLDSLFCLVANGGVPYHPNVVYFFKHLADWAAELGSDFRDYQTVCATSDVYHELVDMALAAGLDIPDDIAPRDWAKRAFLIAVLNGHASRFHMPLARVVAGRWPSLIQFLRRANGATIAGLQRTESWLVIETVAPRLLAVGIPTLTLHDAVFVRESDESAARAVFESVLAELRLPLKLKLDERDKSCG